MQTIKLFTPNPLELTNKPNVMPESVKDRPTRAHEYLFMFTKSATYSYDHEAVREPAQNGETRNRRSVWHINTSSSSGSSHIAPFPKALVEPCILASSKPGDFVLDPFFGSGTVGLVARKLGRQYIGIELNPTYVHEACSLLSGVTIQPAKKFKKATYELEPTLLEAPGNFGNGTGNIPPTLPPTSSHADNRKAGSQKTKYRARRVRASS